MPRTLAGLSAAGLLAGFLGFALSGWIFAPTALAETETPGKAPGEASGEAPPARPTGGISDNPLLAECLAAGAGDSVLAACSKAIDSRQLTGKDLAAALFQRGMTQARRGKPEPAIGDFSAALRQVPDATDVLYARAGVYARLQRHDLAIADLGAILAIDPDDSDSRYRRAWSLAILGRDAEAVGDLDTVLKSHADDIDALMDRGGLLLRLGRVAEAIADFTLVLKADEKAAAAYYNRGRARMLTGKIGQAALDFEQALNLRADNPYAAIRLYLARQLLGKTEKERLGTIIAKFPLDQWPMPVMAMLAGTLPEQDLISSLAASDPTVAARLAAEAHYYLGMAAKAKGELDAARDHFRLAAKGDRNVPEAVDARLEFDGL